MKLTVAICMYNAERYIEETLLSILAQTFQDFDLLIVDDCSSDSGVQIAERILAGNDRQYKLIKLSENHGIAYARNLALNKATTEYLLFVDADDIADRQLVEKEYALLSSDPDIMGVSCWSEFIDENGDKIRGGTYLGAQTKDEFIEKASRNKLIFLPIHTMFNRELAIGCGGFVTSGFPDGKPRYQDYCEELDLWTRMSDLYKKGKAFIAIPEVLYSYRKTNGLSSNHFQMIIKMRYTKTNLLRRRNGNLPEMTFIDFFDSLSAEQMESLHRDAEAADCLRSGVFYLKNKQLVKSLKNIVRSVCLRPGYLIEKVKNNLMR